MRWPIICVNLTSTLARHGEWSRLWRGDPRLSVSTKHVLLWQLLYFSKAAWGGPLLKSVGPLVLTGKVTWRISENLGKMARGDCKIQQQVGGKLTATAWKKKVLPSDGSHSSEAGRNRVDRHDQIRLQYPTGHFFKKHWKYVVSWTVPLWLPLLCIGKRHVVQD